MADPPGHKRQTRQPPISQAPVLWHYLDAILCALIKALYPLNLFSSLQATEFAIEGTRAGFKANPFKCVHLRQDPYILNIIPLNV